MFKNPLKKYQQGGKASAKQQEQLVQLFQAAAQNAQVDPQALVQKASEIGNNEEAAAQFMQGLQLCAQGDPQGIKFIQSLFQQPAYKKGGKILDFICKHAKGGYVTGCGCKQEDGGQIQSAQSGTLLGHLYNRFIGRRVPNTVEANNRRIRTWTDRNGVQHIIEDANVNGNSTTTTIDINGADTIGRQKITTGDNRYRSVVLQSGTPEWRTVMSRNVISKDKQGGRVEKAQDGSVIDYYKNKWSNDYNRIKQGWSNFKNSAPGKVWGAFMPNPNSETGMIGAFMPGTTFVARIPKQKPTIRISNNLGNGKFSAIDDFGKTVIYDAERDKGLFQIIDKNTFKPKPGLDWDIDKLYGQSLPVIEPTQYDFSKLGQITISWPEFIGKTALKWAPGIVGSAALGSYIATKKDKKKNFGGGDR